jgi:transketolase
MKKLILTAKERCLNYRVKLLEMSQRVSAIHLGGTFSSTEILDGVFNILMKKEERENFILSKGHCSALQYVILNDLKILSEEDLKRYSKSNGKLGVHPEIKNEGLNASTGSLGQGLSMAAGFALSNKKKNVYVVLSDGELQEGSTWEAVMAIRNLNLKNIIAIIDNNDLQSLERSSIATPSIYPIDKKFKNFGWDSKICDGHNTNEIVKTILDRNKMKPFCLVAKTIKGYPVSFMKNNPIWHYRSPSKNEFLIAMGELKK